MIKLVALTEQDRENLREASKLLEEMGTTRSAYLSGGLAGLSGRVPLQNIPGDEDNWQALIPD